MTDAELVDAYASPLSKKSTVKDKEQAIADGDWLSGLHIWLYRPGDEPVVFCQLRGSEVMNGPGMLDATAAGHYIAGEHGLDGLRELQEEVGIDLQRELFTLWGTRLYVGVDAKGRERKTIVDVYSAPFDGDVHDFRLDENEVEGLLMLPIKELLAVNNGELAQYEAVGVDASGMALSKIITSDSMPHNLDNYHQRMIEYLAIRTGVLK